VNWNDSIVVSSNTTINVNTGLFQLQVLPMQYRKDKYYQKNMKYYTVNFDRIQQEISIEYIRVETKNGTNTTIIPDNKLCTDYSDSNTMYYYYFQPSYSLSSVICAVFLASVSLVTLFLQILFRNYKLVRSRLLSEIPCNIAILATDLMMIAGYSADIYYMNKRGVRNIPVIVMLSYIRSWFMYAACWCYILNSLRYLYMLNFYRLMKQGRDMMRFQRILTSKLMFVVVLSVAGFVMIAALSIIGGFVGMTTIVTPGLISSIVSGGSAAVVLVTGLSCIIIEMIASRSIIKKHGIITYFRRDPLYIKLQMFTLLPNIVIAAPYAVLCTIIDANYTSLSLTNFIVVVNALLFIAFGLLARLMMSGVFICSLQLWLLLFQKKEEKKDDEVLFLSLMEIPECYDMMVEYCRYEFSLENFLFWKHMKDLNETLGYATLTKIADLYMKPYGPMQVNLPNSTITKYFALMDSVKERENQQVHVNEIHKIVMPDVLLNLNDTFSRFRTTKDFIEWQQNHDASKHLIESQFAL